MFGAKRRAAEAKREEEERKKAEEAAKKVTGLRVLMRTIIWLPVNLLILVAVYLVFFSD